MALISCPECSNKVSDFAASCPSCGCPIKQPDVPSRPSTNYSSVVVSDFDMSFGKMVAFMVKASIAVIPAFLILLLIAMTIGVFFGVWGGMVGMANS